MTDIDPSKSADSLQYGLAWLNSKVQWSCWTPCWKISTDHVMLKNWHWTPCWKIGTGHVMLKNWHWTPCLKISTDHDLLKKSTLDTVLENRRWSQHARQAFRRTNQGITGILAQSWTSSTWMQLLCDLSSCSISKVRMHHLNAQNIVIFFFIQIQFQ